MYICGLGSNNAALGEALHLCRAIPARNNRAPQRVDDAAHVGQLIFKRSSYLLIYIERGNIKIMLMCKLKAIESKGTQRAAGDHMNVDAFPLTRTELKPLHPLLKINK